MEVLTQAPETSSFTSLAEHESTTPASFYTGPPVLHYYSDRCKLIVLESELDTAPALANLVTRSTTSATNGTSSKQEALNGEHDDADGIQEGQKTIEGVDVWVTSDKLLLYSTPAQTGLSISYPSISLHAIQSLPRPNPTDTTSQGLYMQLINVSQSGNSNNEEDEDLDSVSLTIIPTASAPPTSESTADADEAIETEAVPEATPVQAMFAALSNCSNLHPDPAQDGDEEGAAMAFEGAEGFEGSGLPPPMPGSGGWITAENMHEYFNEVGEYIGPLGDEEMEDGDADHETSMRPLGPGAGHARPAEDGDNDETKWRRTD